MPDAGAVAVWLSAGGAVTGGVLGLALGRVFRRAVPRPGGAGTADDEAARLVADARLQKEARIRQAELEAREQALVDKAAVTARRREHEERLGAENAALLRRELELANRAHELASWDRRLVARAAPLSERLLEAERARERAAAALAAARDRLVEAAGEPMAELRSRVVEEELDGARAAASALVRHAGDSAAYPDLTRTAKRLLGIAASRFEVHTLTERHPGSIPLPPARNGRPPVGAGELAAIAAVAGVTLTLSDAGDAVRLEGQDGVGREIARRCLSRLLRRPTAGGETVVRRMATEVAAEIDREIVDFGERAFALLEIEPAHPDIVRLVGRLNWRTSFTQNQWKHALEAAFLCGMMAEELGLEARLARRAALLHDIGKALTHELDGSHAVIGAERARRLGEAEVVANAIGAHHTDEPFATPYAYLVAAADAMSGARPGARRQSEDTHVAKIADLERLSRSFPGVAEAFAVQGGREVRVVVDDATVDDRRAVDLSREIALAISRQMTFPGQIRVTVIRAFEAIERAG